MISPNIFSVLKPTVLSYATQYVGIWRSKRQDKDANKKRSEGYCKGGRAEMKKPRVVIEGEI
jgi:hypothetical protein